MRPFILLSWLNDTRISIWLAGWRGGLQAGGGTVASRGSRPGAESGVRGELRVCSASWSLEMMAKVCRGG